MHPEVDASLPYQTRVIKGKAKEARIIQAMASQCGLTVRRGTQREDTKLGIDCHVKMHGKEISTQIKARQSGDDVEYEVLADVYSEKPGRDTRVQAELYAVVSRGKLILIKSRDVRQAIKDLYDMVKAERKRNYMKTLFHLPYRGVNCEMRIQDDRSSGETKLMAYIPLDFFIDLLEPVYMSVIDV